MKKEDLLKGKSVLIVDDEPDILETLQDLLALCSVTPASSYEEARDLLATRTFDLAILDIMGVSGYDLLEITAAKKIVTVMLTAYALSPDNVQKSYRKGAAYYLPKEEMVNIASFLEDILDAKAQGKSTWGNWYRRLASFAERTYGPNFRENDKDFWDKLTFY